MVSKSLRNSAESRSLAKNHHPLGPFLPSRAACYAAQAKAMYHIRNPTSADVKEAVLDTAEDKIKHFYHGDVALSYLDNRTREVKWQREQAIGHVPSRKYENPDPQ